MTTQEPSTLEEIIEWMKSQQLDANENYSIVLLVEQKIKEDIDILFERLAGGYIHEIQSKIGYIKSILNLVIESKGAFDYKKALESIITQMEGILALYHKSGVPTTLKK